MKSLNLFKLILCILFCELAGIIGSIFTSSSIPTWYTTLVRPSIAPPNWVFGPVWTTLFALMGIALFLIIKNGIESNDVKRAVYAFGFQLFLNVLWSIIFFGLKSPAYALLEIVVLWAAILHTIILFKRVSIPASLLLIPYILWVTFAMYLNYMFWVLN